MKLVSEDAKKVLEAALGLPAEARAAIAGRLLESLENDEVDENVEAAWSAELKKRMDDIDAGRVKMLSVDEARRFILSDDPDDR